MIDGKFQNEGWGWAGSGANPWHLDNQTESMLFLTNESGQVAGIGFAVTAGGVHYYLTKLKLQPHETRVINLRSLRDAQAPDFRGHRIPATATDGSVSWIRFEDLPVEGRLVVIERKSGVASNYDCCICACPPSDYVLAVSPSSVSLLIGLSAQFEADDWKINCNGPYFYADWTNQVGRSSSAPSVASVSSTGLVTASSGGSTTITASTVGVKYGYNSYKGCYASGFPLQGSGTMLGQVPTYFVVTGNVTLTDACSINGVAGTRYHRKLTYQVQDQEKPTHKPIAVSGMAVAEHLCNQADGCQLGGLVPGFWQTNSTGTITPPDDVFMCSAAPRCPTCVETWNQGFSVSNNKGQQWSPMVVNGSAQGAGNDISIKCSQYPSVIPGSTNCQ